MPRVGQCKNDSELSSFRTSQRRQRRERSLKGRALTIHRARVADSVAHSRVLTALSARQDFKELTEYQQKAAEAARAGAVDDERY